MYGDESKNSMTESGGYSQEPQTSQTGSPYSGSTYGQASQSTGSTYGQTTGSTYSQSAQSVGSTYSQSAQSAGSTYGQSAQSAGSTYGQTTGSTYGQSTGGTYSQSAQSTGSTYGQSAQSTGSTYGQTTQTTGSAYGQTTQTTGSAYGQTSQTTGSAYGQSAQAAGGAYAQQNAYSQGGYSYKAGAKPRKEKKPAGAGKKVLVALACGLAFGVMAGAAIYGVNYVGHRFFPVETEQEQSRREEQAQERRTPSIEQTQPIIPEREPRAASSGQGVIDASAVVEDCMPSIVAITNKSVQYYQGFWGFPEQFESEASGSGIIVGENDEELLVVTNSHVIDGASELTVQFADGESYDAQIKGSKDDQDLAIIAVKLSDISNSTMDSIKIATLGDSDTLKVGQPVIAIGNSLGYGQTVTSGIVSALDRDFSYDTTTRQVIQTDAAINPGNSGGALLNLSGEVVGINEAKYASTSVEGVGYAIPISTARPIIDDLVTKTTRTKVDENNAGFLGVYGVDVTEDAAATYGMPRGVYVAQVTEDSAAEKGGIVKGDIITEFAGESVSTMEELKSTVACYAAGTEVEITLQRMGAGGYEENVIKVTLGKKVS